VQESGSYTDFARFRTGIRKNTKEKYFSDLLKRNSQKLEGIIEYTYQNLD
jgi:hypothetical protein